MMNSSVWLVLEVGIWIWMREWIPSAKWIWNPSQHGGILKSLEVGIWFITFLTLNPFNALITSFCRLRLPSTVVASHSLQLLIFIAYLLCRPPPSPTVERRSATALKSADDLLFSSSSITVYPGKHIWFWFFCFSICCPSMWPTIFCFSTCYSLLLFF